MICESTKSMRFSNLNQPATLHINLYFFLIQTTLQLRPLAIIFLLEGHVFQKNLFLGIKCYPFGQSDFM